MLMNIPEAVAERLEQIAQQEGRSVGELLEILLDRYTAPPPGSLAELAQNAREAGLASPQFVDTAEHSHEILRNEFANYLKKRMDNADSDR